ncbi:MAG: 2-amino-4-hydroxy-6-hydroxymethyldihydropteridine diphosphokinase [Oceanobacter sp.]
MPVYMIGIGSNIQAERNIPLAQQALEQLAEILAISPVLKTAADGPHFSGSFHNQLLVLESPLDAKELKQALLAIEESLGREPKSPERRYHNRTIDLDILLQCDSVESCLNAELEENYYQAVLSHWNLEKSV